MIKKKTTVIILERIVLGLLALILVLRLIIYRALTSPDIQDAAGLMNAISEGDGIIALLSLVAGIILIFKLTLKKEPFRRTTVDIPILLFFSACAFSLFGSVEKGMTITGIKMLCVNLVVFYALRNCLNSFHRRRFFIMFLLGLALAAAVLGIYEYFFIYGNIDASNMPAFIARIIELRRVGSFFDWPNLLAGFLALMIPVCVGAFFAQKKNVDRLIMALAAAALFTAMFFTSSILCWVSFIAIGAVFSFLFMVRRMKEKKISLLIAYMTIIALSLTVLAVIIAKRIDPFSAASLQSRIGYLRVAFAAITGNPLTGTGFDTFGIVSSRFAASSGGISAYAHNSFLQVWVETGIAGFAGFLWLSLSSIRYGILNIGKIEAREERVLFAGLVWGITAFISDNLFNMTALYAHTSIYWWACLGIIFSWKRNEP